MDSAAHTRIGVSGRKEGRRPVLVWRAACDGFLQVQAGGRQRAKEEPRRPEGIVGDDRERGVFAPGAARSRRSLALCATVAIPHKTGADHTRPGQALGSRPPADTTRVPACRRAPPRALPVLWPSPVLRRGLCTRLRLAGYAQASLAASSGSRALS